MMESQSFCAIELRNASGIRLGTNISVKFDEMVVQNVGRAVFHAFDLWPRVKLDWAY